MNCSLLTKSMLWLAVVAFASNQSYAAAATKTDKPSPTPSAEMKPTKKSSPEGSYSPEQAMKILKLAEEIRSPEKAESGVELKTVAADETTIYGMKILRSTKQRAHIDFLSPPEERGRKMLAKGRNYWSTFPDSKKVVAISRREMIGNSVFSVADMFQIDTEADYTARVVAEESENGVSTLKLDCTAKTEDAPYHRIEYWVEKSASFPLRAKFYGTSGKHLKTLFVETRKQLAGRLRPEVVRMEDATVKGKTSWWKTKEMRSASIPDNVFTIEFLQNSR